MNSGFLMIGLCLPMVCGILKPNRWYGFRTRRTLADPETWYWANRTSGRAVLISGALMTVTASLVLLAFRDMKLDTAVLLLTSVGLGSLGIAIGYSFAKLSRRGRI
jgi:hypothetical protein